MMAANSRSHGSSWRNMTIAGPQQQEATEPSADAGCDSEGKQLPAVFAQFLAEGDESGQLARPQCDRVCGLHRDCADADDGCAIKQSRERKEGSSAGDGIENARQERSGGQPGKMEKLKKSSTMSHCSEWGIKPS